MTFTPYENHTISTNLDSIEILERLTSIIEPVKIYSEPFYKNKPFQGQIKDNKFKITRIKIGGLGRVPVIIGNIEQNRVNIKIRLHGIQLFSLLVIFIISGLILFLSIINKNYLAMLMATIVVTFAYVLHIVVFKKGAYKDRIIIENALNGK